MTGLGSLPFLNDAETRSVSAENPTGQKGKGGMAIPDPTEIKPAAFARSADDLGQGWKVRPFIRVNAGETATLMDVDGPGIIQHIWLVEGLKRQHVLRFYWDGEEAPSVEVPAPDFFAVGHERFGAVNSIPVTVNTANALNCYWPMPFRKHCRVTLANEGADDLELLAYQITYTLTEVTEGTAYFHAQWRRASATKENPYVILDQVKGKGRYVGTFLAWTQFVKGWFGEGEIRFFIDGDHEFPSICGTGTEDYFCSSWGFPNSFTGLYTGNTLVAHHDDTPPVCWSLYRWHIQDSICFKKDLKVTIQALGWGHDGKYLRTNDNIASVTFWYQTEPHAAFPELPELAMRGLMTVAEDPYRIEAENLKVAQVSAGTAVPQSVASPGAYWTNDTHLQWTDAKPGDNMDLTIPVEKAGKYDVLIQLTRSPEGGIVQLLLNGKPVGHEIDLYAETLIHSGEIGLGYHELSPGDLAIQIKIAGANPKAAEAIVVGVDYISVRP
ncbi:MAG: DUF2961 domain-containing protein [Phycisphaerales bacterium]|nr:DUF2961 domain-containing protein [Phycisphaerales bacterium]